MRARAAALAAIPALFSSWSLLFSAPGALAAPGLRVSAAAVTRSAAAAPASATPDRFYRVRPGDTLSGIASKLCGRAGDWTGLFHVNLAVIGGDPDLILPGRVLRQACFDPPVTRTAARTAARTWHAAGGDPWDGHHSQCGDGDLDGYDMPCAVLGDGGGAVRHSAVPAATSAAAPVYGGTLSFAQLEQLWMRAGGPSWAAARAARIAECESGGSTAAHNPSGASGLWQILGQVVGGNVFDPYVNALNAVAKFRASGDTFAQWVCQG